MSNADVLELLYLDPELLTSPIDFELFLERRAVFVKQAFAEKNRALIDEIIKADELNLIRLKVERERTCELISNFLKVMQYNQISEGIG